jgi:hypothetical protein
MPSLRVLSWNLRTFGDPRPKDGALRRMAAIIVTSQADIALIQEVQIGAVDGREIDSPISGPSRQLVADFANLIGTLDPDGGWMWAVSGVDSGSDTHMRDAYAFLWKSTPSKSKLSHADAPLEISALTGPVILRQEGTDAFPGRRPGMLMVNVKTAKSVTPVNLISYHAQTPCNVFSKGNGAGYAVAELATLPEIGGGRVYSTGWEFRYEHETNPLPMIDTLVCGDFNFSMDQPRAELVYKNLLENYQGCVSDLKNIVYTTYGPSSTQAFRLVSAYDNIFALRKHDDFTPALTCTGKGSYDFIHEDAKLLGEAIGIGVFGTQAAWYVIHYDQYKKQSAADGVSDHLPVWADFAIGDGGGTTASHILPTSGANNNCLFHAIYGANVFGQYVDVDAATHRTTFVQRLTQYATTGAFPSGGRFDPVRGAVLASMLNEFSGTPLAAQMLRVLIGNATNPFLVNGFAALYATYLQGITNGRMLYLHEAELIAIQENWAIVVNYYDRGTLYHETLNEGGTQTVNIFHAALHFERWQP